MNNNIKVVGIDPAPGKHSTIFDGERFWTLDPVSLGKKLEQYRKEKTLICWDAPLTGKGQDIGNGSLSDRPIEKFLRGRIKAEGVSILPYSGCPHWTISRSLLGLPKVGNYDRDDIPFKLLASTLCDVPMVAEVHPAVAVFLWLGDKFQKYKSSDFKKGKSRSIVKKLWNELISLRGFLEIRNLGTIKINVEPQNDDELDALIGYILGIKFVNGDNVYLLGDGDDEDVAKSGAILIPSTGLSKNFNTMFKNESNKEYYGSQKAMLQLISDQSFPNTLNQHLTPVNCEIPNDLNWFPKGFNAPKEAELKTFIEPTLGNKIEKWWLAVSTPNTRTPNWDFISYCKIDGKEGVLLVEAKGHVAELSHSGKSKPTSKSENSILNHQQIGKAIEEVRTALKGQFPEINISRDHSYQLSNRLAHAWWLASHGIPTILLYVGFLDCIYVSGKKYKIFKNDSEWQECFQNHLYSVGTSNLLNKWVDCGNEKFILCSISIKTDDCLT